MALFVLAFALALAARRRAPAADGGPPGRLAARSSASACCSRAASVFTFSVPGLAWFALAAAALARARGARRPQPGRLGARCATGSRAHRSPLAVAALIAGRDRGALAVAPGARVRRKIADVQESAGRLSSPVFPGEALGIWPAGDFRIVRGEVTGSLFAVALGALGVAYGAWICLSAAASSALLAMLVAGGVVYVGARAVRRDPRRGEGARGDRPAGDLVALRALLDRRPRATTDPATRSAPSSLARAAGSTLLALRAAPVGFDERQLGLERLAEPRPRATRSPSSASTASPATTCAAPSPARPPATSRRRSTPARRRLAAGPGGGLRHARLRPARQVRYAITTAAAYQSTPPPNFEPVASDGDYVLWRAPGRDPAQRRCSRARAAAPGAAIFDPRRLRVPGRQAERDGEAVVLAEPVRVADYTDWRQPAPPEARVAGPGARLPGAGRGDASSSTCPPAPRATTGALAPVPLAGAADGARSTASRSPSCRPRSTACT